MGSAVWPTSNAFLAALTTSFLPGLISARRSLAILAIVAVVLLSLWRAVAKASIMKATSCSSLLISSWKAAHAAFCDARTFAFACFSIASSSSTVAIGSPPGLKFRIHSRNFTLQSYTLYHSSNSGLLYRSWLPLVLWPCGWVTSSTWIKQGTCSSRHKAIASSYTRFRLA